MGFRVIKSRQEIKERLKTHYFDLCVIGGGATGAGIALDAALRGLSVALVEKGDFSSGTSSRSTKLIHGGVRYLENALKHADFEQFKLVYEGLQERAILLKIAPHITRKIALVVPLYSWKEAFLTGTGLKIYDWLAGKDSLGSSTYIFPTEMKRRFPKLNHERCKGGVLFYDGQFDDARFNISLILTATQSGAEALNYLEVQELRKEGGRVTGVHVRDVCDNERFVIHSHVVINATGPYVDAIRLMDNPREEPLIQGSLGVHLFLSERLCSEEGIVIPKTSDGRILFVLPWKNGTLVGTTDTPSVVFESPQPRQEDIDFILEQLSPYFDVDRETITATWAGIRPLTRDPKIKDSSKLSRHCVIEISASGLITIAGGKWTIYRKMAELTVDAAIRCGNFQNTRVCQTKSRLLLGGQNYSSNLAERIVAQFKIDLDIAEHLAQSYGDQTYRVLEGASKCERIVPQYPFIWSELEYGVKYEYVVHPEDFLARRIRLAFIDFNAAASVFSRVNKVILDN